MNANISWLSGGKDDEGTVSIGGANKSGSGNIPKVSDDMKQSAIDNSKVKEDYYGKTFGFGRAKKKVDMPKMGNASDAKATLNEFANSLKVQLKNQMGSNYNEQEINKLIKTAINKTVLEVCKNAITLISWKTKDLIDKFVDNFNKLVEESSNSSTPTEPFSKEDVIGSDDMTMTQYIQGSWESKNKDSNEAILNGLVPGLKESIKSHCPNMSDSDINSIIEQAKAETLAVYDGKAYVNELIDCFLNIVKSKINATR